MAFEELRPAKPGGHKSGVRLGTWNMRGACWRGMLTFNAAIIKGATNCSVAFDAKERRLRVRFGDGPFKIAGCGDGGGGRVILPDADWLPPRNLRALWIEVESHSGHELMLRLPGEWPQAVVAQTEEASDD